MANTGFWTRRRSKTGAPAACGLPAPPHPVREVLLARPKRARDYGLAHLTLHTGAYNTNARAFYAAIGFAEEEVRLTRPIHPA